MTAKGIGITTFVRGYVIGLVSIGGYFVLGAYAGNERILSHVDSQLLPLSIFHILLLFLFACRVKKPRPPLHRVQNPDSRISVHFDWIYRRDSEIGCNGARFFGE